MLKTIQSARWKALFRCGRVQGLKSFTTFSSSFSPDSHPSIPKHPTVIKKRSIKPYINIEVREEDLEEIFSRSSGPGGQSVNKTNSRVQLTHKPTNITVTCQEQRDLFANRKIARKKLKDQLDLFYNGDQSKVAKKIGKIKRRKSKAKRRAKEKYGSPNCDESDGEDLLDDEGVEEGDDLQDDNEEENAKSTDKSGDGDQPPLANKSQDS